MSVKARLLLAKLLIFFAAVFLFGGAYLELKTPKVYDPVKDVVAIAGMDEENISVTTSSEDKTVKNEINEASTKTDVIHPVDGIDDSKNNSNSDNSINKEDEFSYNSPTTIVTPSVDETNSELRYAIENIYGVKVKYGEETSGYGVGGMSTVKLSDANVSQTALTNLNRELSLYPTGFFKELTNKGYPITFYLIQRYSTPNVTGVTDSSSKSIIISIAIDYDFSDTLHHEIYHYIEKYLIKSGASFAAWNSLNPGNFTYGTINSSLAYTKTYSSDAVFVNSYAETSASEDRASTFEYMMKYSKAACLNNGSTVWLKARVMCEQIEYFIDSVNPDTTEYWERHVYN